MNSIFKSHLHCESAISEITQFHHDDQNENQLNYFHFFQQFVEFQNETSYCRMTLLVNFNEKELII